MAIRIETGEQDIYADMYLFNKSNNEMLFTLDSNGEYTEIRVNKEQAFQIVKHLIIEFNLVFK